MLDCDNSYWRFSLAVYAAPDVAAECLALQRALNIDVNVLLFCAWLGCANKIRLTDETLAAIDAQVRQWHETVVRPLRAIRQDIKPMPAMEDDAVKELRQDIARIELRAEQIEQAMLFEMNQGLVAGAGAGAGVTSAADAVRHNVMTLLRHNMSSVGSADSEAPQAERLIAESIAYRSAGQLR